MPIKPTYPGVYVQEIPSGVHTITGVSTSVTAFAGLALTGPVNEATHILSYADYERSFGGLVSYSEMSYAINQFFLNGGSEAWVIRLVGQNTKPDMLILKDSASSKNVLQVNALYAGDTDRYTDVFVEDGPTSGTFNLIFVSTSIASSTDIVTERFVGPLTGPPDASGNPTGIGLSMNSTAANYVLTQLNGVSQLVTVEDLIKDNTTLPAATTQNHGTLTSGAISNVTSVPSTSANSFRISLDGSSPYTVTFPATATYTDLQHAATAIQNAVQVLRPADPAFSNFTCTPDTTNNTLTLASGTYGRNSSVSVRAVPNDNLASDLNLAGSASGAQTTAAQLHTLNGAQGGAFVASEEYDLFIADRSQRQGIYALEAVDLFNLLCLPGITDVSILSETAAYCQERGAFLIVDSPHNATPPALGPNDMYKDIVSTAAGQIIPKTSYAAIYYPWILVPDPLNGGALRPCAPCGTMAGVYSRIDSTRGVWKAPAGTETSLVGVQGLEYQLKDAENGILNPQGVNCLRVFPAYGPVCWGSRTLLGSDAAGSEYKYIPIRRLALYIEESLYQGTQWVVFEPNDEPLWAQIRLNVGAFMHNLFRQGAFQGTTPSQAYFVKCDGETTTQNDRDLGIVNIVVGFAPLKPAEFVIIQIQQIAGQIQV